MGKQVRCTLLIPDLSQEGAWGCVPLLGTQDPPVFINLTDKGIRISFPRETDRSVWAWYSPDLEMTSSTLHHITIELSGFSTDIRELNDSEIKIFEGSVSRDDAERLRIVTFTHKLAEPRVIGFGTPFHGIDATVDGYVNQDTKICGVASLSEILRRKDFTILIEETQIKPYILRLKTPRTPETFGYGEVHTWDMTRYRQQITKLLGHTFVPEVRFENANERDTALTQMHRIGEEPVKETTQFVCLLEPNNVFKPMHWRAARRALRGDASKLEVTFKPPKGAAWSATWEASHLTFASSDHLSGVDLNRRLPLLLTRPEKNSRDHKFHPYSHPNYEAASEDSKRSTVTFHCHVNLRNEELRVFAINRLSSLTISPSTMEVGSCAFRKQAIFNELLIGNGLWPLQKQGVNVQLPSFDIFSGIPTDVRDACLNHVFEDDKARVQQYFGKLYLGLGLVSGPPRTGKSHLASIVVILMCFNKSIKQVYVAAASNGATDNIIERIDGMSQKIIGTVPKSHVKHFMLLRGYSLNVEVGNCTMALFSQPFKDDAIWNPSPWKFSHSLCWWTLRVLGSERVPQLDADNNLGLWALHQRLGALVAPSSNDSAPLNFQPLVKLAKGLQSPSDYRRTVTQESHKKNLIRLMELVVGCADVVATTPATSTSWIYRSFNDKKARAAVFDEAATMFCSDGLLVYGNSPRPMVAIGDPKQLAPNLATAFELLRGNKREHDRRKNPYRFPSDLVHIDRVPTNRFAQFAKISWLSWFIHLGWPVLHLYTQHRMAEGLFDLSLNAIYRSLVPHFTYSPSCHPSNFSLGLKVEEYLIAKYHIKPSPENTLQPVFFNCVGCPCREYPDSLSRLNPRQADVIAKFLVKMISELKLPTEDIVVLTPYRANIGAIGRRFRKETELKGVEFTSFNKFQGREAQIVVLALCVDENTGPLFVAEERSLNVALARQRSSLLIFGDINTRAHTYDIVRDANEEETHVNPRVFEHVLRMIKANGRIARLGGNENVDPDSRWLFHKKG
ncbi:hypothetical protein FSPOR_4983 [Fusarium sporotrichioides]|uniref:DNA2/NAM7 helicase-like C-terminal domain-containing protein n=1 Tax=Fusarium sporotrichioides TaxID=5514 RepID=A0A395S9A4_FUSSP|nr:hypothetical protein FSPOR_4983 [Fusarium sporotrichioides]